LANPQNGLTNVTAVRGTAPARLTQPAGWIYFTDANQVMATDSSGLLPYRYLRKRTSAQTLLQSHYSGRNWFTGTLSIATRRDDTDPLWFLLIPFAPVVLIDAAILAIAGRRLLGLRPAAGSAQRA
jgi:hypothetical protein